MTITVLDGGTTNPGDLSWEPLEKLGDLTVYADTPANLIRERARNSQGIIINRILLSREVLVSLPNLRYIGTLSTGFNTIDLSAARDLGITVCNVPQYCVSTVAQMAFSLLLALCNHCETHSALVRGNGWNSSITLNCGEKPIYDLTNKTLGILGYGNIGKAVAGIGKAMGMRVIAYSKSKKETDDELVSLDELFRNSDVISIHCALNSETQGLVSKERLGQMKQGALLINTARGAIIDEQALAEALNSGHLAGAGLDVLAEEPPKSTNPLLTAKNCIITPHIAWSSPDARNRLLAEVAQNLEAYINGAPKNVL